MRNSLLTLSRVIRFITVCNSQLKIVSRRCCTTTIIIRTTGREHSIHKTMAEEMADMPSFTPSVATPNIVHIGTPPLISGERSKDSDVSANCSRLSPILMENPEKVKTRNEEIGDMDKVKSKVLPSNLLNKVSQFVHDNHKNLDFETVHQGDPVQSFDRCACAEPEECSSSIPARSEQTKDGLLLNEQELSSAEKVQKKPDDKEKKSKKKKKRKRGETEEEEMNKHEGKAAKKLRPNYFVAVQITNPQIKKRLEHVQRYITAQNSALSAVLVPVATAHLTVMVLHLASKGTGDENSDDTIDDMTRAKAALDVCQERLQQFVNNPVQLRIASLGNFGDQVVFAKVEEGAALDDLTHITDVVRTTFAEHNLESTDPRPFQPHITIMKMSKLSSAPKKKQKQGPKKIPSSLYKTYSDANFGPQTVLGLQLCAMMKKKDESGYYQVEHSVSLVPPDHTASGVDSDEDFDFSLPETKADSREPQVITVEFERSLQWEFLPGIPLTGSPT